MPPFPNSSNRPFLVPAFCDEEKEVDGGVKTIYLTRHGESQNNLFGKIGGNAELSDRGEKYAGALNTFISSLQLPGLQVWTTQYRRTQLTGRYIDAPKVVQPLLGEISAGEHDNMTYEEIAEKFPVEFAMRDADKLCYRYPGGESYLDVVERVGSLMKTISSSHNLLIISHQATLRCLLAMLLDCPLEELPYLKVPLHTVIKLSLEKSQREVEVEYHKLPVDCVDTFRPRPSNCDISRDIKEACVTVPFHL